MSANGAPWKRAHAYQQFRESVAAQYVASLANVHALKQQLVEARAPHGVLEACYPSEVRLDTDCAAWSRGAGAPLEDERDARREPARVWHCGCGG